MSDLWNLPGRSFHAVTNYIPVSFPWWIFLTGEGLILVAIVRFLKKRGLKAKLNVV
jgi:hypothetical protein